MKYVISPLLFCLLLLSCQKNEPEPEPPVPILLARESDDQGFLAVYDYDDQNRMLQIEGSDYLITFVYSTEVVASLLTFDNGNGGLDTIIRAFDLVDGYATQQRRKYEDDLRLLHTYQRDSKHRVIREDYFDETHMLPLGHITNEYDVDGNLIKTNEYDAAGNLSGILTNEFEGKVVNTLLTGDVFWYTEAPYAVSRNTFVDKNGTMIFANTYTYELDDMNRIVKSKQIYQNFTNASLNYTKNITYEYR